MDKILTTNRMKSKVDSAVSMLSGIINPYLKAINIKAVINKLGQRTNFKYFIITKCDLLLSSSFLEPSRSVQ